MTARRWIRRSLRKLTAALAARGFAVGRDVVRRILRAHDITPKGNVKHLTPQPHPDRDRQFRYVVRQWRRFARAGLPVISVDSKKRELVGRFRQAGRVWCTRAPEVYTHDFREDAVGLALPYGVYDVARNTGYVAVSDSADTPDAAVAAVAWWWRAYGRRHYPTATALLILADGGGSNGWQPRRWKQQLQVRVANVYGLTVTVCHYPPGASKWNPIEHRLFSQISQTWAGTPLTSFEVLLDGVRATTTAAGLRVHARRVTRRFTRARVVSDAEMASLALTRHDVCPKWNYTIRPHKSGR
jgi:hypothetical protein